MSDQSGSFAGLREKRTQSHFPLLLILLLQCRAIAHLITGDLQFRLIDSLAQPIAGVILYDTVLPDPPRCSVG